MKLSDNPLFEVFTTFLFEAANRISVPVAPTRVNNPVVLRKFRRSVFIHVPWMVFHHYNSLCIKRIQHSVSGNIKSGWNIFWIGRIKATDVHSPRRVYEIAFRNIKAHMADSLCRTPKEKQVAGLKVVHIAEIDLFAITGLLRCIAGK